MSRFLLYPLLFFSLLILQKAFNALCHSTHLYGRRLVLEWADTEETVEALRRKTADHFHGNVAASFWPVDTAPAGTVPSGTRCQSVPALSPPLPPALPELAGRCWSLTMRAQGEAGGIQATALSDSSLRACEPVNSPSAGPAEAPRMPPASCDAFAPSTCTPGRSVGGDRLRAGSTQIKKDK